ncbi:hypothetical protein DT73_06220 [Mangrovibacter sp. MFB070]|nr:hypothetical protein DT73_06220 [Mangrovibacter sp. MFB070]
MHHPLATSLFYIAAVFREINPFLNNWPAYTRPQVVLTRFMQNGWCNSILAECQAIPLPDMRKRHTLPDKIRYATLISMQN